MADAIEAAPKTEVISRYRRLKSSLAKARETTRETVRRGTGVAMVAAGGFAAGFIDERMPEVGGLPTNLVMGGGLALAGIMDAAGDQSDLLCSLGAGVLAGAAYGQGVKMSQELTAKLS